MTAIDVTPFYFSTPLELREGGRNDYQQLIPLDGLRDNVRRELQALCTRLKPISDLKGHAYFSIPLDDNTLAIGRIEAAGEDARGRQGRTVTQGVVADRGEYVNAIKGALFDVWDAIAWEDPRATTPQGSKLLQLPEGFEADSRRTLALESFSDLRATLHCLSLLVAGAGVDLPNNKKGQAMLRALVAFSRPDAAWALAVGWGAYLRPMAHEEDQPRYASIPHFDLNLATDLERAREHPKAQSERERKQALDVLAYLPEALPEPTRVRELVQMLGGVGNLDDLRDFVELLRDDFSSQLFLAIAATQPRVQESMRKSVVATLEQSDQFDPTLLDAACNYSAWCRQRDHQQPPALTQALRGWLDRHAHSVLAELWPKLDLLGSAEDFGVSGAKRRWIRSKRLFFIIWSIAMIALGMWFAMFAVGV